MGDKILLRGLLAMVFETEILLRKNKDYCRINFMQRKCDNENQIIHIKVYKNLFYMLKFYIITTWGKERRMKDLNLWKKKNIVKNNNKSYDAKKGE